MVINQPSNQIKLTNVSLVRMKKGKKRFEIACYKNKVMEWRNGNEKDIDNVVQIPNVFFNVSKGQAASTQDLEKAFGSKMSREDIMLEILNKGELQVGEKERNAHLDRIHNEVLDIVASKLIDPRTKRVYTTGMIEKALDQLTALTSSSSLTAAKSSTQGAGPSTSKVDPSAPSGSSTQALPQWTGVSTSKSAKSQALDAMRALIAHQPIPVIRVRMRLRISCPNSILKQTVKPVGGRALDTQNEEKSTGTVKDRILGFIEQLESQDVLGDEWEAIGFVEPGAFKTLSDFLTSHTKGQAKCEILDSAVNYDKELTALKPVFTV